MKISGYELLPEGDRPQLGLIVLQSDVTIEDEFRFYFEGQRVSLFANRIPFENEVNAETLQQMALHIGKTVSLFPVTTRFQSIGYACTSGSLQIGSDEVQRLVKQHCQCEQVTNPMKAVLSALQHVGARNIAFLAPYSQQVTQGMIDRVEKTGVKVTQSATYDESQDIRVGRISPQSIYQSAVELCQDAATAGQPVDAIFMTCTNLKCASVIPDIEAATGVIAMSSNMALAWDMARLAGSPLHLAGKGRLVA